MLLFCHDIVAGEGKNRPELLKAFSIIHPEEEIHLRGRKNRKKARWLA